jgi:hypothetical protein
VEKEYEAEEWRWAFGLNFVLGGLHGDNILIKLVEWLKENPAVQQVLLVWTRHLFEDRRKPLNNNWLTYVKMEFVLCEVGNKVSRIISWLPVFKGLTVSSSSISTTARCGLWPVEQYPAIFSYLSPTISISSLLALQDPFLPLISIFSWVFPFESAPPLLQWRSSWAFYFPPFSPGDLASLSFVPLSILVYFLL